MNQNRPQQDIPGLVRYPTIRAENDDEDDQEEFFEYPDLSSHAASNNGHGGLPSKLPSHLQPQQTYTNYNGWWGGPNSNPLNNAAPMNEDPNVKYELQSNAAPPLPVGVIPDQTPTFPEESKGNRDTLFSAPGTGENSRNLSPEYHNPTEASDPKPDKAGSDYESSYYSSDYTGSYSDSYDSRSYSDSYSDSYYSSYDSEYSDYSDEGEKDGKDGKTPKDGRSESVSQEANANQTYTNKSENRVNVENFDAMVPDNSFVTPEKQYTDSNFKTGVAEQDLSHKSSLNSVVIHSIASSDNISLKTFDSMSKSPPSVVTNSDPVNNSTNKSSQDISASGNASLSRMEPYSSMGRYRTLDAYRQSLDRTGPNTQTPSPTNSYPKSPSTPDTVKDASITTPSVPPTNSFVNNVYNENIAPKAEPTPLPPPIISPTPQIYFEGNNIASSTSVTPNPNLPTNSDQNLSPNAFPASDLSMRTFSVYDPLDFIGKETIPKDQLQSFQEQVRLYNQQNPPSPESTADVTASTKSPGSPTRIPSPLGPRPNPRSSNKPVFVPGNITPPNDDNTSSNSTVETEKKISKRRTRDAGSNPGNFDSNSLRRTKRSSQHRKSRMEVAGEGGESKRSSSKRSEHRKSKRATAISLGENGFNENPERLSMKRRPKRDTSASIGDGLNDKEERDRSISRRKDDSRRRSKRSTGLDGSMAGTPPPESSRGKRVSKRLTADGKEVKRRSRRPSKSSQLKDDISVKEEYKPLESLTEVDYVPSLPRNTEAAPTIIAPLPPPLNSTPEKLPSVDDYEENIEKTEGKVPFAHAEDVEKVTKKDELQKPVDLISDLSIPTMIPSSNMSDVIPISPTKSFLSDEQDAPVIHLPKFENKVPEEIEVFEVKSEQEYELPSPTKEKIAEPVKIETPVPVKMDKSIFEEYENMLNFELNSTPVSPRSASLKRRSGTPDFVFAQTSSQPKSIGSPALSFTKERYGTPDSLEKSHSSGDRVKNDDGIPDRKISLSDKKHREKSPKGNSNDSIPQRTISRERLKDKSGDIPDRGESKDKGFDFGDRQFQSRDRSARDSPSTDNGGFRSREGSLKHFNTSERGGSAMDRRTPNSDRQRSSDARTPNSERQRSTDRRTPNPERQRSTDRNNYDSDRKSTKSNDDNYLSVDRKGYKTSMSRDRARSTGSSDKSYPPEREGYSKSSTPIDDKNSNMDSATAKRNVEILRYLKKITADIQNIRKAGPVSIGDDLNALLDDLTSSIEKWEDDGEQSADKSSARVKAVSMLIEEKRQSLLALKESSPLPRKTSVKTEEAAKTEKLELQLKTQIANLLSPEIVSAADSDIRVFSPTAPSGSTLESVAYLSELPGAICGFLSKLASSTRKNDSKGEPVRTWRRRYFILVNDQFHLFANDDLFEMSALRIDIDNETSVQIVEQSTEMNVREKVTLCVLEVKGRGPTADGQLVPRTWYLQGDQADIEMWQRELTKAMSKKVQSKPEKQEDGKVSNRKMVPLRDEETVANEKKHGKRATSLGQGLRKELIEEKADDPNKRTEQQQQKRTTSFGQGLRQTGSEEQKDAPNPKRSTSFGQGLRKTGESSQQEEGGPEDQRSPQNQKRTTSFGHGLRKISTDPKQQPQEYQNENSPVMSPQKSYPPRAVSMAAPRMAKGYTDKPQSPALRPAQVPYNPEYSNSPQKGQNAPFSPTATETPMLSSSFSPGGPKPGNNNERPPLPLPNGNQDGNRPPRSSSTNRKTLAHMHSRENMPMSPRNGPQMPLPMPPPMDNGIPQPYPVDSGYAPPPQYHNGPRPNVDYSASYETDHYMNTPMMNSPMMNSTRPPLNQQRSQNDSRPMGQDPGRSQRPPYQQQNEYGQPPQQQGYPQQFPPQQGYDPRQNYPQNYQNDYRYQQQQQQPPQMPPPLTQSPPRGYGGQEDPRIANQNQRRSHWPNQQQRR
ncbi:hypothetical protein HK098_008386 [Nowakowskiella sp. JEL0407]|nr:hypothetical protein HK098_008386 [Nowakowskiella sp. JEL0407]